MREIRFRAWDKDKKKMIWGSNGEVRSSSWVFMCYEANKNFTDVWKLMQWTGLQDKNGKDIYEGDIVKHTFYKEEISEIKFGQCSVGGNEYPAHGFYYICDEEKEILCLGDCLNKMEVIGNCHQNPELLK